MQLRRATILTTVILGGLYACAAPQGGSAQTTAIRQATDSYFIAAQTALERALARQPNTGQAKNIILFIGDGMSIPTITAARIHAGQRLGVDGVSHSLTMETLPYSALSRTYSHDFQVPDSAPTATAMTTGVKTINDVVGLGQNATLGSCASTRDNRLLSIFEMAELAGLGTGIVTTTRITHATPASAYAHSAHRDWEADSDMPAEESAQGCIDIASQLVEWEYGDGFEVVLGGGRQKFQPTSVADPEYPEENGSRADGRDLIAAWQRRTDDGVYVWNQNGFGAVDPATTGHLLGLFEPSDMKYEADRADDSAGEPSLADMTAKALDILRNSENGFLLMVEGGRIDHAHHAANAARALGDTLAFDDAIAVALEKTSAEDTLIIVTADHSHTLSMGGSPARGNPILGLVADAGGELARAQDAKPYTTLGYANGPGATDGVRADLSDDDTTDIDFVQQGLVPLGSETHGGDDVAIFAGGPYAHLFQGVVDQQFIFHVMAFAGRISERAGAN